MGYSNWDDDMADINAVIEHFEREGYYIYALIGHSRGKNSRTKHSLFVYSVHSRPLIYPSAARFSSPSADRSSWINPLGAISCLNYAATSNHVPLIPYIISISSRFDMSDVKRKHGPEVLALLEKQV